jgi:hypothetical protein
LPQRRGEHHSGGLKVRLPIIIASVLLVAACGKGPATGEPNGPLRTDDAIANNVPNAAEKVETGQAGDLPAAGAVPRFVGNWAKDQQSCQSAVWKFTDSTLRTPEGESCSFNRVTEAAGGYDIQATCSAKDGPQSELLKIRFAESAKAMLLDSKELKNAGLVFCGRDV